MSAAVGTLLHTSDERRAVLVSLRSLLGTMGSANDAADHGYHQDADRMRADACHAIRDLMNKPALPAQIFPKLQCELDSRNILDFGRADLCDELEKSDAG
jgi:hypothetical protein